MKSGAERLAELRPPRRLSGHQAVRRASGEAEGEEVKPRYKDRNMQRIYESMLSLAADRTSELYHKGNPRRGAGHRAAFWDG